MDCDITQEEGEIFDEEEESESKQNKANEEEEEYKPIERPNIARPVQFQQLQHSDSSSDDDSDGGKVAKIKNPLPQKPKYKSKGGNIWAQMLQEEDLTDNLKSCEVNRKRKFEVDRGVETYNLENVIDIKKPRTEDNAPADGPPLIRKFAHGKVKSLHRPKVIKDLEAEDDCSDEELGKEIAEKLDENNAELIQRVVATVGRTTLLDLYKKTQNVERKGGMLILNKTRRRTSGGIFLFLVKNSTEISEAQKKIIFEPGNEKEVVTKSNPT